MPASLLNELTAPVKKPKKAPKTQAKQKTADHEGQDNAKQPLQEATTTTTTQKDIPEPKTKVDTIKKKTSRSRQIDAMIVENASQEGNTTTPQANGTGAKKRIARRRRKSDTDLASVENGAINTTE